MTHLRTMLMEGPHLVGISAKQHLPLIFSKPPPSSPKLQLLGGFIMTFLETSTYGNTFCGYHFLDGRFMNW
jgi:hypothetical protein